MTDTDVNDIRRALVGDSGIAITLEFVLAIRSFTRWPVDAFAVDVDQQRNVQTFYWLQGGSIGRLTATREDDNPNYAGVVRPVSAVTALTLFAKVIDENLARVKLCARSRSASALGRT